MVRRRIGGPAALTLIGASFLAAGQGTGAAQPFFGGWGGYYAGPERHYYNDDGYGYAPPRYEPRFVPGSRDVGDLAASSGYRLIAPPRSDDGRLFVAVGEDRGGRRHRLVFDVQRGRLLSSRLLDAPATKAAPVHPAVKPPTRAARKEPLPESRPAVTQPAAAPAAVPSAARPTDNSPAQAAPPDNKPAPAAVTAPAPAPVVAPPSTSSGGERVRVEKDPLALPPEAKPAPVEPRPGPTTNTSSDSSVAPTESEPK